MHALVDISGVGPATAQALTDAGFASVESVAGSELEALTAVAGIGPSRAASMRSDAQRLLAAQAPAPAEQATTDDAGGEAAEKTRKKARKLKRKAKALEAQAKVLAKRAKKTKSKKKRQKRLRRVADLEAAARKARKKAKSLAA